MKLIIEGGGDDVGKQALRAGFGKFLEKAGLQPRTLRIIAAGGREQAFRKFCIAVEAGEEAILLVDSEGPATKPSPWKNLEFKGKFPDSTCHLVVECMEAWLAADPEGLADHFKSGFRKDKLPAHPEARPKKDVMAAIQSAAKDCKTRAEKVELLRAMGSIDPQRVRQKCQWADRFLKALSV